MASTGAREVENAMREEGGREAQRTADEGGEGQ